MSAINNIDAIINTAIHTGTVRAGWVHPVNVHSLYSLERAAQSGMVTPILFGPEHRIRSAAENTDIDLTQFQIYETEHSHGAAQLACEMARDGKVDMLVKGSLSTDELMSAVLKRQNGLRTERRISHVWALESDSYPRMLLVTDAAINVTPNLLQKRDIIQNAIDMAHAIGIECPRVAILSAMEFVKPEISSTIDAAALCKMADRGQIVGAILDGPLAFDTAISPDSCKEKGLLSPVAGNADIFVMPDLEAGNIMAKQLNYLGHARSAGVVLGARVPIVLTSRSEGEVGRLASVALACLLNHHRQKDSSCRQVSLP